MDESWDAIIVGGGVAGLSAALTLGRSLRRVAVVDAGRPRNRFASHMHAVLGHEGAEPAELVRRGRAEASGYGVAFYSGTAISVRADERRVVVTTDAGDLTGRALVVATGITDDLPDLPGLAERWGKDVLHCPYCHGWEVRGSRIGVLGIAAWSAHQAQLLRQWTDRLTFFTAGAGELDPALVRRLRARDVELVEAPVTEVLSQGSDQMPDQVSDQGERLAGVRLADGRVIELDALFVAPPARPHDAFLEPVGLKRTQTPMGSFVAVDPSGLTSHPRIWAIGNVVDPVANVPIAIGAGASTAAAVNLALVSQDFDDALATTAVHFWEQRYAGSERVWSGRVNATMADAVKEMPVPTDGIALDLGCGEGGDAVWLAEQGWRVTAVDLSPTAVARGAAAAESRGLSERISWIACDLADWRTEERFDLVTASFFHSADLPRTEILRRAAERVRPGGRLLLVSHVFETEEDVPPWSRLGASDHAPELPTPAEEIATLALEGWVVERAEIKHRDATGPDGAQTARVKDGVVLLRRV